MKTSIGAKTLAFPTPVFIVGTYDAQDKPNVMAVAWGGICCSKPPCVSISVRKATYTYGNLMERRAFTISIPSEEHVQIADYFGMASGRDEDKFEVAGVTPVRSTLVDAPYVAEFPWVLECKVVLVNELGLHVQFVAEILDVKIDDSCLDADGKPRMDRLRPFAYAPTDRDYYATGASLGKGFTIGRALRKET